MEIPELTSKEFESFTKNGVVLIDFFAEWCMPCLMMAPVIEELSEKFSGKIKFGKVNIDDYPELAHKFSVMSIPNFVLFRNGEKIGQFIGAMQSDDFEDKLRQIV